MYYSTFLVVILIIGLVVVTGRRLCSVAMLVFFYSLVEKWVFRPAGVTCCADKRESWHGVAYRRSATSWQVSRLRWQKCGNTSSKTAVISYFDHKFVPQGLLVCNVVIKL